MNRWMLFAAAMALGVGPASVWAQESQEERIAELERKVELLTEERQKDVFGEIYLPPAESIHGLSPAASKVYRKEQGLSIGGYGEALYQNFDGDSTDEFDFLRAILYVGYKFSDQWVLNTEFEFEHASTSEEGSVSVEFAYIDYLAREELNLRAGLLLIPMGLISELHEPTTFLSARRPDIETRIIPSTWRENGVGIFGDIGDFSYKAYAVTSLEGEEFSSSGLRGGRQKGSEAKADDFSGILRLDWKPADGLLIGGSGYYGDQGQDLDLDITTTILEGHIDWRYRGFQFRSVVVKAEVDDAAALSRLNAEEGALDSEISAVGEDMFGWYVEAGYNILNEVDSGETQVIPFIRYEAYDTQDSVPAGFAESGENDVEVITVGVNYKPLDEIVFKADYQFYDNEAGTGEDQLNLAMGYVF